MSTPVIDADEVTRHPSAHDRRAYGYGLLAVALIAALCVPGLVGRRASGRATAAPPAPPPSAGQCLAPIELPADQDRMTTLPQVPCTQPHSAELVFIGRFGAVDQYPATDHVLLSPRQTCQQQVQRFLGLSGSSDVSPITPQGATRQVRPQAQPVVTVPSHLQWNSGQRWYACQVRPAGDSLPKSYDGSARQAATGSMPAAFGRCAQVIGGDPVPCTEPHYAEQLTDFVAAHEKLDCHLAAGLLIGAPDPTFHGELSLTGWQASGGRTACWATSTTGQAFVGTLLGWGNHPFPG